MRSARHFRLLALGYGISAYGTYLDYVALNIFIYHITGSALDTGLFMAFRLAATAAAGIVSGRLVSRRDRKLLMAGADATAAIALLVLVSAGGSARVPVLFGLAIVLGTCSTLSQVALRSSIPEIVGSEQRVGANSLLVTVRSMAMVAGFVSAGLVVASFGYTAAFALDATTYVLSALILLLLPIKTRSKPASGGITTAEDPGERAWLAPLRAAPVLAVMIGIRMADGLGSSSHNVGLPIYSSALNPTHPTAFISQFWATWAVGNIIAQQAWRWYARRTGAAPGERVFVVAACVMSGAFIVVFSGLPTLPAVIAALVAGIADGTTEIAYVSRLQEAPDEQRGRLFGLSASAENTSFGLGMVVSGALMQRFSPFQVVAAFHGLAIGLCTGFLLFLISNGAFRKMRTGARQTPENVYD
ncbi:MAG TPA: MFS transporter [Streptosporangiaceae bacterium]|nr:MFS transporter [Streptosporangiaceae bacterium]